MSAHFGFSMKGFWNEDFSSCIALGSSSTAALYSFMNHKMCLDNIPSSQRRKEREKCIVIHIIFQKVFCIIHTSYQIKTRILIIYIKCSSGRWRFVVLTAKSATDYLLSAERLLSHFPPTHNPSLASLNTLLKWSCQSSPTIVCHRPSRASHNPPKANRINWFQRKWTSFPHTYSLRTVSQCTCSSFPQQILEDKFWPYESSGLTFEAMLIFLVSSVVIWTNCSTDSLKF